MHPLPGNRVCLSSTQQHCEDERLQLYRIGCGPVSTNGTGEPFSVVRVSVRSI